MNNAKGDTDDAACAFDSLPTVLHRIVAYKVT
jgi:hypothetical protein